MSLSIHALVQLLSCMKAPITSVVFSLFVSATAMGQLHLLLQELSPLRVHVCVICNAHLVSCQRQFASAPLHRDLNNSYYLLSRVAGPGEPARSIWPEFPEREPDVAHHLSSQ